jgi:ribosomal protein S18 acetylase RimI-like enzyme
LDLSANPTRANTVRVGLPLVERTNALPIEEFVSQYVSPLNTKTQQDDQDQKPEKTSLAAETQIDVYSAATISPTDLDACLDLVEFTSGEDYAASSGGWSRPKKRKEMKLPDMKYLILRDGAGHASDASQHEDPAEADKPSAPAGPGNKTDVLGFLSFMVTYEDGKDVVYCYEIHLSPRARGRGLGVLLMTRMEEIGRLVGVEKAMLTVFKANATARRFYEKGGYEVDEYSPQPRRLRNGTIKEFDYLILSKRLKD